MGYLHRLLFCSIAATLANGARAEANAPDTINSISTYTLHDSVPVSCLNRTIDTGEHITDDQGQLQYTPFFTCNETSKPLSFSFGDERDLQCTLASISDSMYHLLEFYVHNDAPLTCRVPAGPVPAPVSISSTSAESASKDQSDSYVPLVFALSGALQLSHLHINTQLNVLLHTMSETESKRSARIIAASAYSSPSLASNSTRVIIGDPLSLRLQTRWYSTAKLPPSTTASQGLGGHVHLSTFFYCLVSCGGGIALSLAYFRGIELPKRLRKYGKDRVGGERGTGGYAFPGSSLVNGHAGYGPGKRD